MNHIYLLQAAPAGGGLWWLPVYIFRRNDPCILVILYPSAGQKEQRTRKNLLKTLEKEKKS